MPKNTQVMLMKNLSVKLGSKKVLNEVNLAMSAGERLAIVGPSGSGKSTILRLLAGLLLPSSGLLLSPPLAALLMALSSISVVFNALSLKSK